MLRDWMPTVGGTIAFVVLSSIGSPLQSAQAAQLQFSFTTESGGTGSFLLNTDAPLSPDPGTITDSTGQVIAVGRQYIGAISNLLIDSPGLGSFQFPGVNFEDFVVFPSFFPNNSLFPAAIAGGCDSSVGMCPIQVSAFYQGDTTVTTLSANPQAYELVRVAHFDEVTGNQLARESITSQSAVAVPEPSSIAGLVVAGGLGAKFLRKRRTKPKMAEAQT